ncbi:EsaB/YukD family protein, partial [Streptomyces chartreusis]
MTDSAVAELCRLTVRAPSVSVDLAVPADVPVADLLPTLLRYVGEEAEEAGQPRALFGVEGAEQPGVDADDPHRPGVDRPVRP